MTHEKDERTGAHPPALSPGPRGLRRRGLCESGERNRGPPPGPLTRRAACADADLAAGEPGPTPRPPAAPACLRRRGASIWVVRGRGAHPPAPSPDPRGSRRHGSLFGSLFRHAAQHRLRPPPGRKAIRASCQGDYRKREKIMGGLDGADRQRKRGFRMRQLQEGANEFAATTTTRNPPWRTTRSGVGRGFRARDEVRSDSALSTPHSALSTQHSALRAPALPHSRTPALPHSRTSPQSAGGNTTVTLIPCPGCESTEIRARCWSTMRRAMERPSPAPSVRPRASSPR